MEGNLIVVLQCGVLFVGHLQRSLGDVVHLKRTGGMRCADIIKLVLIKLAISSEFEATMTDRIERPLY